MSQRLGGCKQTSNPICRNHANFASLAEERQSVDRGEDVGLPVREWPRHSPFRLNMTQPLNLHFLTAPLEVPV